MCAHAVLWACRAAASPPPPPRVAPPPSSTARSSVFVDLRVPAAAAAYEGTDADADFVARVAAHRSFAGVTRVDGDVVTWQRVIDFRPPTGVPAPAAAVGVRGGCCV